MFRTSLALTFLLVSFVSNIVFASEKFATVKDLSEEWMLFKNGAYEKYTDGGDGAESIHFAINKRQYPNCWLKISSDRVSYLFINGTLIQQLSSPALFSIDSLSMRLSTHNLNVSIYQPGLNADGLETLLLRPGLNPPDNFFRMGGQIRDFAIAAGLCIIILFVVMVRINPKLAGDYFSLTRVLSIREAEDNQSHSRFAISSNIVFYIFCSLLMGLYLTLVFAHLPADHSVALDFTRVTFGVVVWAWVKLSVLILILLFTKAALIYALSNLFGMNGIAGVHLFNWVRFVLIVGSALMVVSFIYYISRGINPSVYMTFQYILITTSAAWIVILFLKLNNRVEHSLFHLFSYICATELIPMLIAIKVLFQ